MSSEDQQLLARISQLAGQINRHKNQMAGISAVPAPQYPSSIHHHAAPSAGHAPYQRPAFAPRGSPGGLRGRGYGGSYRVKKPAPYRNRTLILNGAPDGSSESASASDAAGGDAASRKSGPSWVSRNDRHMQLINSDVYEKEAQARARAMEQTRLQKQQQRDHHERSKLRSHFSHLAHGAARAAASSSLQNTYQVFVAGIPFYIAKNGSKLVKVPGDPNPPSSTPKTAIIGGVKFYRSKNGNLYRHGVVKAQRRTGLVKKIDELCKTFSTTGILDSPMQHQHPFLAGPHDAPRVLDGEVFVRRLDCLLLLPRFCFTNHGLLLYLSSLGRLLVSIQSFSVFPPYLGSCSKGPRCRYIHDAAKVAACKDFLLKGDCPHGNDCDLSHDLTPERTPFCVHYAKGNCTNANCVYTHSPVSAGALVCRPFGLYGYCEQGGDCADRHVLFECPDFSNTGECKTKGCKLPHRERASFMRRANVTDTGDHGGDSTNSRDDIFDDPSSDDDSVNSDDIDSDEVEEFVGADAEGDGDLDFVAQKDYIGF